MLLARNIKGISRGVTGSKIRDEYHDLHYAKKQMKVLMNNNCEL
jgi:hypothetical protein